jgi:hypothetical protein
MNYEAEPLYFLGVPGCGKTFLACRMLPSILRASGWPVLVIDRAHDNKNFASLGFSETYSYSEALTRAAQLRQHVRYYPRHPDHVTWLFQALEAYQNKNTNPNRKDGAGVIVFFDEWGNVYTNRSVPIQVETVFLSHRHLETTLIVTTQYVGAMSPAVVSCAKRAYVFKHTGNRSLVRLNEEYNLDRDQVRALTVPGEHIVWSR